ncbi:MAG: Crp/Fnr family transcriptional regulator [Bacteroidia bacterium]|jgi:CRP-like cAMP-binding protein|nr:Crp/Fnr family transcriptional regulator [Bacteroidia bacterium]
MKQLESTLRFGAILNEGNISQITSVVSEKHFKAGEHFLRFGDVAHEIAFIDSGILRVYDIAKSGEEVTKYFARSNQFFSDLESYYTLKPCENAIQAVTDTTVYVIHRKDWEQLTQSIPNFYLSTKTVTEATLLNKLKDNDFLNYGSAEDKYRELLIRNPEIIRLVPLQYIASYLKITPQSLSRIRSNLAKKKSLD